MLTKDDVRDALRVQFSEEEVDEYMVHVKDQDELANQTVAIIKFIANVVSVYNEIKAEDG